MRKNKHFGQWKVNLCLTLVSWGLDWIWILVLTSKIWLQLKKKKSLKNFNKSFIENLKEKEARRLEVTPGMNVIVLLNGLRQELIEILVLINLPRHLVLHIVFCRAVLDNITMKPTQIWRKTTEMIFSKVTDLRLWE